MICSIIKNVIIMKNKELEKDSLIEEKIKRIEERIQQIDASEAYSNPKWKTNCYPTALINNSLKSINLKTVMDIPILMRIYEFLMLVKEVRDKAVVIFRANNIPIPDDYYKRDGFLIEDYLSDIMTRMKQLNLIQTRSQLVFGKLKLEELYSQSKKDDIKLNGILENLAKFL